MAVLLDVGGGCCYRVLPQSLTRQLPPGGSLSYCAQCSAKEPIVPAAAESRNRAKPHRVAEGSWSRGPPPRGDWSKDNSMQSQDWSEGGSPEGADVPNANSAAPSGPLCFFLRVEKEELTQQPINKGIVSMADGGTPSGFVRSRATSRIHLPRGGRLLASSLRQSQEG